MAFVELTDEKGLGQMRGEMETSRCVHPVQKPENG